MRIRTNNKIRKVFRSLTFMAVVMITSSTSAIFAQVQTLFAEPEDAVAALKQAVVARDLVQLAAIFGPRVNDYVSGDPVADKNAFDAFAELITKSAKLDKMGDNAMILLVGDDDWPFAVPIVRTGSRWRFDSEAGIDELLNRRIGANEIDAVYACQTYAIAQFEYFNGDDRDNDQVSEYAQKIASSPGKKDGLFWEKAADDEDDSPLGELFAAASAEGYRFGSGNTSSASPFRGYNFKVLFRQGKSAPGGRFGYIINGNMIAGFALVAYPATWGSSGVMTFLVNQEGRVYQKNLGPRSSVIASAMTEYDPDVTWALFDLE